MSTEIGPLLDYLSPLNKAVEEIANTWRPDDPEYRADGYRQIMLQDPGVPNWLDPAGFKQGTIYGRWYDCDSQPVLTLRDPSPLPSRRLKWS